jgi:DNA-binding transcriptional ArsR family regulator
VNDGINARTWQDGGVDEQPADQEQPAEAGQPDLPHPVRVVEDIGTLKAMADPTRLAIMVALMRSRDLPVMSVKELAAELGEPQTKLYRHMRQLEAAGLIRVAATRVVSGIIEQRYQACQWDMRLGTGMLRAHPDETDAAFRVVLDRFRDGFMTASARGRLAADVAAGAQPHRKPLVYTAELTVSAAVADELQRRLTELQQWLQQVTEDPAGVPISLLVGFYSEDVSG